MQLSDDCRAEIDSMIERRARDFRLDTKLKDACEAEIANMCAFMGVSAAGLGWAGLGCDGVVLGGD